MFFETLDYCLLALSAINNNHFADSLRSPLHVQEKTKKKKTVEPIFMWFNSKDKQRQRVFDIKTIYWKSC